MKIEKVDVSVTSPGRNFVTLKLTTSDGVVGLGDATLNGRELAVASYLRDHVAALLVGREAHNIEDTWQYLYRGPYWRRGPVTMAAIAAIVTGPRRQYGPRYRYCQVSSILCASRPTSNAATWSRR